MYQRLSFWRPRKPDRAVSLKSWLNLSEIQHVLLWKESPVDQSSRDENPAVSTQCQVLKMYSNFAGTFVPVTLSLLSLLYLHIKCCNYSWKEILSVNIMHTLTRHCHVNHTIRMYVKYTRDWQDNARGHYHIQLRQRVLYLTYTKD